jgi:hypothetical protein
MALPPTTGGRKAKHYILAALTAILAAAVVVTVFFVVLSPARIYFSVTNAISHQEKDGGVVLAFTLAANNTSQRAAVKYQSLFVDVSNNTDSAMWIPAKMNTEKSRWHPHGSVATVDGTASLLGGHGPRPSSAATTWPAVQLLLSCWSPPRRGSRSPASPRGCTTSL